jgi:A118 family predicted phage portal protein
MYPLFQKILLWAREVINKMIPQTTVKSAMNVDIILSDKMSQEIQRWKRVYLNNAHWLMGDLKSLNLGAAIAGEIARAVTIEMTVTYTGGPRALFIQEMMEPVIEYARRDTEYACAMGGIIFKPYNYGDIVGVDRIHADQFYPVAFDSKGKMTSVIFTDQKKRGSYVYTRLEFHRMNEDKSYDITNAVYRSMSENELGVKVEFSSIAEWAALEEEVHIVGIEKPLFAYFKYPMANNVDTGSPLGISCYARAMDLLEQADRQWTDFLWEFSSGKRRIYVDELAFEKHPTTGKPMLPEKNLFRTIKGNGSAIGEKNKLFEDYTPTLREENLLKGLDAIMKQIEFECGLAQGTISDPNTIALTATEIKMSKQRTYATITDTQKALQCAFDDLAYAVDIFATIAGQPRGSYVAAYYFDDSIVADHDTQFTQDLSVLDRAMSRLEFRMRNYGEDEVTAQKFLDMLDKEEDARIAKQPDLFSAGA